MLVLTTAGAQVGGAYWSHVLGLNPVSQKVQKQNPHFTSNYRIVF